MTMTAFTPKEIKTELLTIRINQEDRQMFQKLVQKTDSKNVSDAIRKVTKKEISKK